MNLHSHTGQRYQLEQQIAAGGEARIWTVKDEPNLLAKVYLKPQPSREAKLQAMLAAPPRAVKGHQAVAWPQALLYQGNHFVGFLMPHVRQHQPIFNIYHPLKRKQSFSGINNSFLYYTALNLATAVATVHARGHVVGDLNESNVLVNRRALVTLVDCDSFQISDASQTVHRCTVGKAEYTPPELQGVNFQTINRSPEQDRFGLAVLIFQLLMAGFHPFAGVLVNQTAVERVDLHCLKQGWFPYQAQPHVRPPRHAPRFDLLHPQLRKLFVRAFVAGQRQPDQRPTAEEWQAALEKAAQGLVTCGREPSHIYSSHLWRCPWCPQPEARLQRLFSTAWAHWAPRRELALAAALRQLAGQFPGQVALPHRLTEPLSYRRTWATVGLILLTILLDLTGWGYLVIPLPPGYVDLTLAPSLLGTLLGGLGLGLVVSGATGFYHQVQAITPALRDPWVMIAPRLVLSLLLYGSYFLLHPRRVGATARVAPTRQGLAEIQTLGFSALISVLGMAGFTLAILAYRGYLNQALRDAIVLHATVDAVAAAVYLALGVPLLRWIYARLT